MKCYVVRDSAADCCLRVFGSWSGLVTWLRWYSGRAGHWWEVDRDGKELRARFRGAQKVVRWMEFEIEKVPLKP